MMKADSVNIKCGELNMKFKFDVDADGKLLKNVQELGRDMGIVGNADMLLFTGRYMADREWPLRNLAGHTER